MPQHLTRRTAGATCPPCGHHCAPGSTCAAEANARGSHVLFANFPGSSGPRRIPAEAFGPDDPPMRAHEPVPTQPFGPHQHAIARQQLAARRLRRLRQERARQGGAGWLAAAQRVCMLVGAGAVCMAAIVLAASLADSAADASATVASSSRSR